MPLDPFTVNLADRDAERYAQVGMTLELADPKAADLLKAYMPAIRNNILLVLAAFAASLLAVFFGISRLPAVFLGIEGLLILISIVGAWAKFGREAISGTTLLSVPFYILWKIPLYFGFLVKRQTKWVRTERDVP